MAHDKDKLTSPATRKCRTLRPSAIPRTAHPPAVTLEEKRLAFMDRLNQEWGIEKI
jgi:hypothetical protein